MIAASCMERWRTEKAVNVGGAQGVVTLKTIHPERGFSCGDAGLVCG